MRSKASNQQEKTSILVRLYFLEIVPRLGCDDAQHHLGEDQDGLRRNFEALWGGTGLARADRRRSSSPAQSTSGPQHF